MTKLCYFSISSSPFTTAWPVTQNLVGLICHIPHLFQFLLSFLVTLAFNKQSNLSAHDGVCLWTGSAIIKDTMVMSLCGVRGDTT